MERFATLLLCLSVTSAAAEPLTDLNALAGADVVILGEVHDNPSHHLWQAEAMLSLAPSAVVFEMLSPDQAARITPEGLADPEMLADVIGWSDSGWPDFELYQPVFEALGEAAIFGAALPYGDVRAAVNDGAAALFSGDASVFGLDQPLPDDQQTLREAMQAEAHCNALPAALLPVMVEAQRLRDAGFAARVLEALEQTGGPVVLITGNGHARTDWAVPAMIALAAPDVAVLSIGQFESEPTEDVPFDLWRVTDPALREDPCAAFR
ncbi:ChaN family lipoprotein [Nioella aestuarii]|uniref:ChaN family lipoprotein n=1 Tax=Nioella aestuarii TaxID=1662864 RepID=UPI003D7FAC9E